MIKTRIQRPVFLSIILLVLLASCTKKELRNGIPNFSWIEEVGAKRFPTQDHTPISVNDFGAVADTSIISTQAIQAAIDACAAQGGGKVVFEAGDYCSGSIFLKSGVQLHLDEGVRLFGSQKLTDYPLMPTRVAGIEMEWPAGLITAVNQDNVALTGSGEIWGQGKVFWDSYWKLRQEYDVQQLRWIADYDCMRPRMVLIQDCTHATILGNKFFEAGFWTIHILYSSQVTIDGVFIDNNNAGRGPSTDGIDIDSSNRILVQNCDISCNDDNICLKAGRDADGLRVNRPTEFVIIRNSIARHGDGLFTCGSETSGGIRNVLCYDMKAIETEIGLRFKSALNRGGIVENIWIANVEMIDLRDAFQINLNWNPNYSYTQLPESFEGKSIPKHWQVLLEPVSPEEGLPQIRNIYFTDIVARNCKVGMVCEGVEQSPIRDFHFTNVFVHAQRPGRMYWAQDWTTNNVTFEFENSAAMDIQNSQNAQL